MMWNGSGYLYKPSNAVDVMQSLVHDENEKLFDDTVDFGTTKTKMDAIPTIDNRMLVYHSIRLPCGIQVMCAPNVLTGCPMILRSLQTDLVQIFRLLPWSVHSLIRRTNIWVNASYAYGSRDDPRVLRHSTAHHQEGWLVHCARDRPEKARGIEIYSCYDFERMRLHWNGCGLLLHELCHLIHQFCLGLDHPVVQQLYEQGRQSGNYNEILRRDWAGLEEDYDMAYAMVDLKEFFAEMSVTYLSNGYHSLDKADKTIVEECSPPLLQPSVTDRVLKHHGIKDPYEQPDNHCWVFLLNRKRIAKPKLRIVNPLWQEQAIGRSCLDVVHCNKFYPFTRGQLKHHDPELFHAIQKLWREIVMYEDPEDDPSCCKSFKRFLPSFV